MLNWYRALPLEPDVKDSARASLRLSSSGDRETVFLEKGLAEASLSSVTVRDDRWIEKATHWVQLEEAMP